MDPTNLGVFNLVEQRLAWVDRRQKLLAQNVANANTPGYKPDDVAPFQSALSKAGLSRTSPQHLASRLQTAQSVEGGARARSPDGNEVSMEQQLAYVADTASIQELALNLHRSYASMLRTAFGRGA